ncbi:hypothetical protein COB55_00575 [Candidatus Wolfebacteria bacterium]|nr:MAG: hypothetical protein COB55_00575 [Candidatus Wolfebacteria bacterium]
MQENKQQPSNVFLKGKTEKVVSALYMITDFLQDSNSMRVQLRDLGDCLIKQISEACLGNVTTISSAKITVSEISSFLVVSVNSRIVSPMNGNIVKSECIKLAQMLNKFQDGGIDSLDLNQIFLNTEDIEQAGVSPKGHLSRDRMSFIKDKVVEQAPSTATVTKGHSKASVVSGDRKDRIVSIVREKNEVSIKDISRTIHGVSEKTIQRDLVGLVEKGVLLRKGERRWSTYLLA